MLITLMVIAIPSDHVAAVVGETFESPHRSWELRESDCRLHVDTHQRAFGNAHGGSGCEYLRYQAGPGGTKILVTHAVPAARVIEELVPSLWVRSNRPGVQLNVRVVLPRSKDPKTGRPITRLLPGTSYNAPGSWQELRVEDVQLLLERQVRLVRSRIGPAVDAAEAYVDMFVINAYTGPGPTELWVDDLEIRGFASATTVSHAEERATAAVPLNLGPLPPGATPAEPTVRGPFLYVDGRPFFARAIEWRGEPLANLAKLGFNVVWLHQAPTREQVDQAEQLDMWFVAPPPTGESAQVRRTLCWAVDEELTGADAAAISQRVGQLRRHERTRPVLCRVSRDLPRYAGLADLVLVEKNPMASSIELSNMPQWWRGQVGLIRPAIPFWAAIQTELSRVHQEQIGRLSDVSTIDASIEPEQIWLQAIHAASSGVRGILFRSDSRVDGSESGSQRRAMALQAINLSLQTVEPWLAAGKVGRSIDLRSSGYWASTLATERARLLLVSQVGSDQQFVVGPTTSTNGLTVGVSSMLNSDQAYRITRSRIEPIRSRTVRRGVLEIEDPDLISMVALTDDPSVVNYLRRATAANRDQLAQLHVDLITAQLAETRDVLRELAVRQLVQPGTQAALEQTEALIEYCRQLAGSHDDRQAERYLLEAWRSLRQIRLRHWHSAVMLFSAPVASPLCTSFRTLPAHYAIAERVAGLQWGPNEMPAGRFESLPHLLQSRWTKHQAALPSVNAKAELSLDLPKNGRHSLRLASWSTAPDPVLSDWPIWVTSAPVPVRAGELMRIRGSVNLPDPIRGSDGLLIFDTLTGLKLATRIRSTRGWEDFSFYRVAPSSGEVAVVIALSGLGSAFVDDLQLSLNRRWKPLMDADRR